MENFRTGERNRKKSNFLGFFCCLGDENFYLRLYDCRRAFHGSGNKTRDYTNCLQNLLRDTAAGYPKLSYSMEISQGG